MANVESPYHEKVRVVWEVDHGPGTLRIHGEIRNEGSRTVASIELKAVYRNFDGFSLEVDTLWCEERIPPMETLAFAFPERSVPVNVSTCDVVVSRVLAR